MKKKQKDFIRKICICVKIYGQADKEGDVQFLIKLMNAANNHKVSVTFNNKRLFHSHVCEQLCGLGPGVSHPPWIGG